MFLKRKKIILYKIVFDIVILVVFKSIFYLKIHQNNNFLFFKIYLRYQYIKTIKKYKKNN
jgi:hypothetical protein